MIKLGLIGVGNIATTRHIPIILKQQFFTIVGCAEKDQNTCEKAKKKYPHIPIYYMSTIRDIRASIWFKECDAVCITTPPDTHETLIDFALDHHKHVLVEKPFITNVTIGKRLIEKAKKNHCVGVVNHCFQYARSFTELDIKKKNYGTLTSILGVQVSNDERRLPPWYERLPGGLFFDESPHFLYLVKKYVGDSLEMQSVHSVDSKKSVNSETKGKKRHTPHVLTILATAKGVPITLYHNFESPICEWHMTFFFERMLAVVDLFRDTLIELPHDGIHLSTEVLRTSLCATGGHWRGLIQGGVKYLRGSLFWGIDEVHRKFYTGIIRKESEIPGIGFEDGLWVTEKQLQIISLLSQKTKPISK